MTALEKIKTMNFSENLLHSESKDSGLKNPVFVVGVFRAGTSLLYSLLNQHPQVALMYECDAWNFPEWLSSLRFKGNWLARQEFYNSALSRHRLTYGNSLRGLEEIQTPEDLYKVFGQGKSATLWGEKSPFYCFRLRRLAARNPGSPFILIWRDPVEIYRSVQMAGRTTSFFGRPGMLSRLVVYQEKMLEQAAKLEKAGTRIHHVTYSDLVDKTSEVCEGICEFLNVPFNPRMMALDEADLSAVYYAPQHQHLRRGVIQRREIAGEVLDSNTTRKLERFRNRWSRLNRAWFPEKKPAAEVSEPSFLELNYHRAVGNALCVWDDTKRALFEFLPITWLRTYRETVRWFYGRHGVSEPKLSFREQIASHWITILVSYALIAGLGLVDALNPRLNFLPFYMVPCAILALMINWRWGGFAALITAFIGPVLLSRIDTAFAHPGIFAWNTSMRFLLLLSIVLLTDRIRREVTYGKTEKV
jgi:Sulfotransferase family